MFRAHLLSRCEGSVDHKCKQGVVEATCQCLRAGKQKKTAVFKSLHLLFNHLHTPPVILGNAMAGTKRAACMGHLGDLLDCSLCTHMASVFVKNMRQKQQNYVNQPLGSFPQHLCFD